MKTRLHSIEAIVWREDEHGNKHRTTAIVRPSHYVQWENTAEIREANMRLLNQLSKLMAAENGP